jgi:hypothetical protein
LFVKSVSSVNPINYGDEVAHTELPPTVKYSAVRIINNMKHRCPKSSVFQENKLVCLHGVKNKGPSTKPQETIPGFDNTTARTHSNTSACTGRRTQILD